MSDVDRIARLKIEMDDWQPSIWRRVDVPLTASLRTVHDVIEAVMSFEDTHLFEFRAGEQRFAIPDPEWDSLRDRTYSAKTTKLGVLVDRGVTELSYTYDFGDDWRHTITIEATAAADPTMDYLRDINDKRRAPPEDVGRIPGFELLLEAIADPSHEEHDELMRWYGAPASKSSPDAAPSAKPRSLKAVARLTDLIITVVARTGGLQAVCRRGVLIPVRRLPGLRPHAGHAHPGAAAPGPSPATRL
ncbi:pRiA4b ORF-3-like protein [Ancylobacter aquaticus]|uniref:PRiA4b ORF-3-like protein n=1 Tax=Ancylobacter aquaticus TaxID=100 RepID=A0A4R1I670_ANCAQ|nr:plasmid pRiA4b ORF-3 family protein [Ancylobacter aquaticus]TCK28149.1 pRiA4b ORF-3-like protein [Ancylobacter aquaticus]